MAFDSIPDPVALNSGLSLHRHDIGVTYEGLTLDWRACRPLLGFLILEHAILALFRWSCRQTPFILPADVWPMLPLFMLGGPLFAAFTLLPGIVHDMIRVRRGCEPVPIWNRLAQTGGVAAGVSLFSACFYIHMMASANLKPAIFTLRGVWYDHGLEAAERVMFGGLLPTEWFVSHLSTAGMFFWQYVYDAFSLYLFLTVAVAIHCRGLSGGARYTLSLCAGHALCLVIALAYPTMGPVFVHPEWFQNLPASFPTRVFSMQLMQTVNDYTADGAIRHTVSGIAAMPSFHVLAWTCGIYVWRELGRWGMIMAVLMILMNWTSTVVLGWHYALDGAVGMVLGIGIWSLSRRLIRSSIIEPPPIAGR